VAKKVYDSASDLLDKFMLRLPDGMRGQIADVARQEMRSMNGQITYWIQRGIAADVRNEAGVDRNA
jgi:hypothetical protein